jgi:predicted Zn-dependent protease
MVAAASTLSACGGSTGLGLDLVPEEQLAQMGAETWRELRAEVPASQNAEAQARTQRVARRVLEAAGKDPGQWEVAVFAADEANAFTLPGNKIGVYEGMLRVAADDAQLAAVMAHEVAHLEAGHPGERMSTDVATQLGVDLASILLGGDPGVTAALLGAGARYGLTLPYSRNQELEADRLGLRYMAEAGYDPRAAIELWRRMSEAGGGRAPSFLSTHPAPDERIEALEREMPDALTHYRAGG